MQFLILLLAFITITVLVYGLYLTLFASRLEVLDRLRIHTDTEMAEKTKRRSFREELIYIFATLGRIFRRKDYLEKIRVKLSRANVLMRVEEFIGLSLLVGIALFALLYLLTGLLLLAIVGLFIGFKIPEFWVDLRKKKRMRALNAQLPEALNHMSNGLRAGFGFIQAMAVCAREMASPISDEFARVIRDNSLGKPLEEALQNLSDRTEDDDLDMFITAMLIQRQVGGNLAEVLDNISHTIRERVRIKGEIKTLTAQGRLSAFIVGMLPFALAFLFYLTSPEYLRALTEETVGIVMIALALMMQMIGLYFIAKIIDIEV